MSKGHIHSDLPPPYPLAMVICDAIWRDPATGKRFLLGSFSVLHATQFPILHASMAVHVALTNGHGRMPIQIRLVDDEESRDALWLAEGEVDFPDPRGTVEIDFMLPPVGFPVAGVYRFQFFAGGQFLMERRIFVEQVASVR
ncbi:MAG TPA: hypothetical protein VHX65_14185 [Pirellulales bacterium]|nr:hypothetical protein [Pirellulales bacterium]